MQRLRRRLGLNGRNHPPLPEVEETRGWWDYPFAGGEHPGTPIARDGTLALTGWVLPNDEGAEVSISVDGEPVSTVGPTFKREDIEIQLLGGVEDPPSTGWVATIDVNAFPAGSHEVSVAVGSAPVGVRVIDFADRLPPAGRFVAEVRSLLSERPRLTRAHQMYFGAAEPGCWRENASSAWGFSERASHIITESDGWVLAIGAGVNNSVANVIQLDIFDYPNVDVVADGTALPLRDEVVDAVICENVIEHVKDPAQLIREISRVLKPGGLISINGTNLHFTHGFPFHFFNPTEFGMRYLLEELTDFEGDYSGLAVADSLRVIFGYYFNALTPAARERLSAATVGEFMEFLRNRTDEEYMQDPLHQELARAVSAVPARAEAALSANVVFTGRKAPPRT